MPPVSVPVGRASVLRRATRWWVVSSVRWVLAVHSVNAFLSDLNIDGVNLFRLVRYCRESKVLFKMSGYGDFALAKEGRLGDPSPALEEEAGHQAGALHALVGFVAALTHDDSAGRVLVVPPGAGHGR